MGDSSTLQNWKVSLGADAGIADFPASRYLARGEVEGADRIGKLRMVAPAVAARVAIAVLVIS